MKKILSIALILFTLNISAQTKSAQWYTDINQAINKSIQTNKPLMLFFTGKDWCPPCKMTAKYVFETEEFNKWSNKVVLVELDFPRNPAKRKVMPKEYSEIANKLGVRSYPTVWFVDVISKGEKPQLQPINNPIIGGEKNVNNWIAKANRVLQTK